MKKSLTPGSELHHICYPCNNTMSSLLFSTSHSLLHKASLGDCPWHIYPTPKFKPPCCMHNWTASTQVCIVGFFSVEPSLSFFWSIYSLILASFSQTLQSVASNSREVTHTPCTELHHEATPGVVGAALASSARGKMDILERVPEATRILEGLDFLSFWERLRELGLVTLETRRLRGSSQCMQGSLELL